MTEERLKTEVSIQSEANLFDDKENLIVDKILDKRQNGSETEYLVKFLGYEDAADHKWISHSMLVGVVLVKRRSLFYAPFSNSMFHIKCYMIMESTTRRLLFILNIT